MNAKLIRGIWTGVAMSLVLAIPASSVDDPPADDRLNAIVWMQSSAEYRALCRQTYAAAAAVLPRALADSNWHAVVERDHADPDSPPAIILDVDETVLDNSPHGARNIEDGLPFESERWSAWVNEANAPAVPGAVAFLNAAAQAGVRIFYVTNRNAPLEDATRANLAKIGFPLSKDGDCVLMRGEQEDWGSNKTTRRRCVASAHRVIMLFGDDLNDFLPGARGSREDRDRLVAEYDGWWGQRWFVLPNPGYGSWERSLVDFEYVEPAVMRGAKRAALDTRR